MSITKRETEILRDSIAHMNDEDELVFYSAGERITYERMTDIISRVGNAPVPTKIKTTRIGPSDLNYPQAPSKGSAPVQWLIDGEWVHKGWLLPQVGTDV